MLLTMCGEFELVEVTSALLHSGDGEMICSSFLFMAFTTDEI